MTDLLFSDTFLQKGSKFLENPPKITYTCNIDKEINYNISMNNNFLSPKGEVVKIQNLTASYEKNITGCITPKSAICTYTWKEMNFKSDNWNSESVNTEWTFAIGHKFTNLVTFPTAILSDVDIKKFDNNDKIGIDYSDFASLPTVNLLYMLTWDVIGFEEMATYISRSSDSITGQGNFTKIHTLSNTSVNLGFHGCKENSFFHNGQFEVVYLGLSSWKNHIGALFEYRCLGDLEVKNAKQEANATSQTGSSYYFGKILIDVNSGNLIKGDMVELVSGVIINKDSKWIPQQKRRFVSIELA